MSELLLLNGPNLGSLGRREPEVYGTTTLEQIEKQVAEEAAEFGWTVRAVQSDSEADLVRVLNADRESVGAVVNPGALMMAGWSLRDSLAAYAPPWIEVHLSNVWARESFRHVSILSPLADGIVVGLGGFGYRLAVRALAHVVQG